jgi:NTE family protein
MEQKVALVLGSGGARGIGQIGVIEELESQGFIISSVSGSSIGAVVGGIYAMGKIKEFKSWVCDLKKIDVYSLMDVTLSSNGLLKAEKVFNRLKTFIPDMPIEKMNIPFSAVATDIINREEVVFTKGSFYKAARASIAIPTLITPVAEKNKVFVDGAVLNPVPVNRVSRTNGDIVVAVNLYDNSCNINLCSEEKETENDEKHIKSPIQEFIDSHTNISSLGKKIMEFIPGGQKQSQGYFSLLQFTISAMLEKISMLSLEINKPDMVINIPANSAKTFNFHKASQLIDIGRKAAKRSIYEYKEKLANSS